MLTDAAGILTAAIKTRAVAVHGQRVNVRVLGKIRPGRRSEPDLVIGAIRRVLDSRAARRARRR